jgi:hypothetical protein
LGGGVVEQLEKDTEEVTGMLEEARALAPKLWEELAVSGVRIPMPPFLSIHPPICSFIVTRPHTPKPRRSPKRNARCLPASVTSSKSSSVGSKRRSRQSDADLQLNEYEDDTQALTKELLWILLRTLSSSMIGYRMRARTFCSFIPFFKNCVDCVVGCLGRSGRCMISRL